MEPEEEEPIKIQVEEPIVKPKKKRAMSHAQLDHLRVLNERQSAQSKVRSESRRLAGIEERGRARYLKLHALYGSEQPAEVEHEASISQEPEQEQAPTPTPPTYYHRRPLQYAQPPPLINFV